MATTSYWLSFKVAIATSAAKGTDAVRRQSLYDAVEALDAGYWEETTSFLLFEAVDDIDVVGRTVIAGLDPALDAVVIRRVSHSAARFWGKIQSPVSLRGYIPTIARLT